VFIIDPRDNVATLISENGVRGTVLDAGGVPITLADDIPFAHKFAIRPIRKGEQILKYGYSIGTATCDIRPGEHVHIHNLESNRGRGDLFAAGQGNRA